MSVQSKFVNVNPGTLPGDGDLALCFKASSTFGGVTIIGATAQSSVEGTLDLLLLNYGTSGTVLAGTIAQFTDGTATVVAADTPAALTVTDGSEYVDAGEYVVLRKDESAAGNDLSASASIVIEYVDGVVDQG